MRTVDEFFHHILIYVRELPQTFHSPTNQFAVSGPIIELGGCESIRVSSREKFVKVALNDRVGIQVQSHIAFQRLCYLYLALELVVASDAIRFPFNGFYFQPLVFCNLFHQVNGFFPSIHHHFTVPMIAEGIQTHHQIWHV